MNVSHHLRIYWNHQYEKELERARNPCYFVENIIDKNRRNCSCNLSAYLISMASYRFQFLKSHLTEDTRKFKHFVDKIREAAFATRK